MIEEIARILIPCQRNPVEFEDMESGSAPPSAVISTPYGRACTACARAKAKCTTGVGPKCERQVNEVLSPSIY